MAKSKKPSSIPVQSAKSVVKTDIPEELEALWDDVIAGHFKALRPQQQDFLLAYLRCGNQAEAYRRVYNPLAKDHLASNAGGQALESIGISAILERFAKQKTAMLFKVINGYNEMSVATKPNWVKDENGQYENAGEDPDWVARKEALIGIRKVFGLDQPAEVKHSGEITSKIIQVNLPTKKAAD